MSHIFKSFKKFFLIILKNFWILKKMPQMKPLEYLE